MTNIGPYEKYNLEAVTTNIKKDESKHKKEIKKEEKIHIPTKNSNLGERQGQVGKYMSKEDTYLIQTNVLEKNKDIKDDIKYDHMQLGLKEEVSDEKVELRRVYKRPGGADTPGIVLPEKENRKYMSQMYNNLKCEIKASEMRKERSTLGNTEAGKVVNNKAQLPNFDKLKAMNQIDNFNEILVKKKDELQYGIPFEPNKTEVEKVEQQVKYEYEKNVVIPIDQEANSKVKCNFSKNGLNLILDTTEQPLKKKQKEQHNEEKIISSIERQSKNINKFSNTNNISNSYFQKSQEVFKNKSNNHSNFIKNNHLGKSQNFNQNQKNIIKNKYYHNSEKSQDKFSIFKKIDSIAPNENKKKKFEEKRLLTVEGNVNDRLITQNTIEFGNTNQEVESNQNNNEITRPSTNNNTFRVRDRTFVSNIIDKINQDKSIVNQSLGNIIKPKTDLEEYNKNVKVVKQVEEIACDDQLNNSQNKFSTMKYDLNAINQHFESIKKKNDEDDDDDNHDPSPKVKQDEDNEELSERVDSEHAMPRHSKPTLYNKSVVVVPKPKTQKFKVNARYNPAINDEHYQNVINQTNTYESPEKQRGSDEVKGSEWQLSETTNFKYENELVSVTESHSEQSVKQMSSMKKSFKKSIVETDFVKSPQVDVEEFKSEVLEEAESLKELQLVEEVLHWRKTEEDDRNHNYAYASTHFEPHIEAMLNYLKDIKPNLDLNLDMPHATFLETVKKLTYLDSWQEQAWISQCDHIQGESLSLLDLQRQKPDLIKVDDYPKQVQNQLQQHNKFKDQDYTNFSEVTQTKLVELGQKSVSYQNLNMNMNEKNLNYWRKKENLFQQNEGKIMLSKFILDKTLPQFKSNEVQKSRSQVMKAQMQDERKHPLFPNEILTPPIITNPDHVLRKILKDENVDEFVRNINLNILDHAFANTLYQKNKMLNALTELMHKPIKDRNNEVKYIEIKNQSTRDVIKLHENVAGQYRDDYKFTPKTPSSSGHGATHQISKGVPGAAQIKMKENIHSFTEMKQLIDEATDAKLLRYKKDAYANFVDRLKNFHNIMSQSKFLDLETTAEKNYIQYEKNKRELLEARRNIIHFQDFVQQCCYEQIRRFSDTIVGQGILVQNQKNVTVLQVSNFIVLLAYIFKQGTLLNIEIFHFICSIIPRACRIKKVIQEPLQVLACFCGLRDKFFIKEQRFGKKRKVYNSINSCV